MAGVDYGTWVFKNGVLINETPYFDRWHMYDGVHKATEPEPDFVDGDKKVYIDAGDKEFGVSVSRYTTSWYVNGHLAKCVWGTRGGDNGALDYMGDDRYSCRFVIGGIPVHIKYLNDTPVIKVTFRYKGDAYKIISGYGIDEDMKIWNHCKIIYLGRKRTRLVENELRGAQLFGGKTANPKRSLRGAIEAKRLKERKDRAFWRDYKKKRAGK